MFDWKYSRKYRQQYVSIIDPSSIRRSSVRGRYLTALRQFRANQPRVGMANPAPGVYPWKGRFDTAQFWADSLKGEKINTKLVFYNLAEDPFRATFTPHTYKLIRVFCQYRCGQKGWRESGSDLILTVLEALAPYVPRVDRLPAADAKEEFINVMKLCLPISVRCPNWTDADINTALMQLGYNGKTRVDIVLALTDTAFIVGSEYDGALMFLKLLANANKIPSVSMSSDGIANLCVALAKRGSITPKYMDKVNRELERDMGVLAPKVDEGIVRGLWFNISDHIDDTNVSTIIQSWMGQLPADCLRLKVTLQQIPGTGLTQISTILRAIRDYPTFRWDKMIALLPGEFTNVTLAAQAIANNEYYGYRKDLGPVVSTRYRNVGYIAKELIVKVAGEYQLNLYQGWARKPAFQVTIDQEIINFENTLAQTILANVPQQAAGQDPIVATLGPLSTWI